MSTTSERIRAAIVERLQPLYTTPIRRTTMPTLQPTDLPAMSVFIVSERSQPFGEGNFGAPEYQTEIQINISDIRGFNDPSVLEGQQDLLIDTIENLLMTDTTFFRFGDDPFFEAVNSITRRRLTPKDGETYFAELRLEIVFALKKVYEPVIEDDLEKVRVIVSNYPALDEEGHRPGAIIEIETI